MKARELIKKYISFFGNHGHRKISGSSLVPENDPSALFISAGMHPLVPFLLGEEHPAGNRLISLQKCIRTNDIENVGDGFHHTFFLMLGNWSLGDSASPDGVGEAGYFKEEAIAMSFEFLTAPDWLGLDPQRIYVSVFAGDEDAPRDDESIAVWKKEFAQVGIDAKVGERIFLFGKRENWWGPVGETGPCGPDTEMFYDTGKESCGPDCDPSCQCGKYVEIWNDVFMMYNRRKSKFQSSNSKEEKEGYEYVPLEQKNVDTGMGVARVTAVLSGFGDDDYQTELFAPIIEKIEEISGREYDSSPERPSAGKTRPDKSGRLGNAEGGELAGQVVKSMRIVADHVRAAVFAIADGVAPSNTDRGYVVRRFIRRAVRHGYLLGIEGAFLAEVSEVVVEEYQDLFPELKENEEVILGELSAEEEKFGKALRRGLKRFEELVAGKTESADSPLAAGETRPDESGRVGECGEESPSEKITGEEAFDLYQTYGFPLELTKELAEEKGLTVDEEGFRKAFEKHREKSRAGMEKKFAGGLADHSEEVTKLHTATHLLHAALRKILGEHVKQEGSNITPERLRFDFSHPQALTDEELAEVEALVNTKIEEDLPVKCETMSLEKAKEGGALAFFAGKYGEDVKVYSVGDFSEEVCAGPHVKSIGELGNLEIVKESSVGRGKRRVRAILENS